MAEALKKILLVEDNENCRELLTLYIKRLGYEVIEAGTGLEALDRASTRQPDLIMMDLGLPGMTGEKATACLKANPTTKEIPVIINTAYPNNTRTKRALDAGAAEILHKPFELTRLRKLLCKYLSADRRASITVTTEEQNNYRSQSGTEETTPQVRL